MTVITESEFQKLMEGIHKNCKFDSETIIWNKRKHIERLICYNHNREWFVRVPVSKGEMTK